MNELNANGQRHGLWEEYCNCQLRWRCNFLNGLKHGPWESYYKDGRVGSKGFYQNDQQIGFWLYGYSNSKIRKLFIL